VGRRLRRILNFLNRELIFAIIFVLLILCGIVSGTSYDMARRSQIDVQKMEKTVDDIQVTYDIRLILDIKTEIAVCDGKLAGLEKSYSSFLDSNIAIRTDNLVRDKERIEDYERLLNMYKELQLKLVRLENNLKGGVTYE